MEVLSLILHEHPSALTEAELIREMEGDSPEFGARDRVEVGVTALIGAGLLIRNDKLLLPTRAAREFGRLAGFP